MHCGLATRYELSPLACFGTWNGPAVASKLQEDGWPCVFVAVERRCRRSRGRSTSMPWPWIKSADLFNTMCVHPQIICMHEMMSMGRLRAGGGLHAMDHVGH